MVTARVEEMRVANSSPGRGAFRSSGVAPQCRYHSRARRFAVAAAPRIAPMPSVSFARLVMMPPPDKRRCDEARQHDGPEMAGEEVVVGQQFRPRLPVDV